MDLEQYKCEHDWIHVTRIAKNKNGTECLWLDHKCKKCGITADEGVSLLITTDLSEIQKALLSDNQSRSEQ